MLTNYESLQPTDIIRHHSSVVNPTHVHPNPRFVPAGSHPIYGAGPLHTVVHLDHENKPTHHVIPTHLWYYSDDY